MVDKEGGEEKKELGYRIGLPFFRSHESSAWSISPWLGGASLSLFGSVHGCSFLPLPSPTLSPPEESCRGDLSPHCLPFQSFSPWPLV